ncbi:MAG: dehydrogenase, partial [Bacteroidota bacterium]
LAPPMVDSEFVGGSKEKLILLVLHGLQGPVHVAGKRYDLNLVMPGVKNNPALSDKDIADILSFLRNSFSHSKKWGDISVSEKEVIACRENTKDREELYTEEELLQLEL